MLIMDSVAVTSAASTDKAFLLSIKYLTGNIRFQMGTTRYLLKIEDGKFIGFSEDESASSVDIVVSATAETWVSLLSKNPPPGHQSPLYNDGRSTVNIEGDLIGAVAPFYNVLFEFCRILREVKSGVQIDCVLPEVDRDFDSAIGRYMYLRIQGIQYRIYFEESGTGSVPLLLHHTAGADSRQSRHLLEDPDFQKHFRIISYDLPFHGRSLPPTSHRWWEEERQITKQFLMDTVIGVSEKLALDRPVFMGTAFGGMLALDLAYYHPDKFRALIGLNAGPSLMMDDELRAKLKKFYHPKLGNQWMSAMSMANTSSASPGIFRRELGWIYSQSAPGVADGALYYYMQDHDLTLAQAAEISEKNTALYLLTGQDDPMGGEHGTVQLAKAMPATPFKLLPRLGHYGAVENPEAFKTDVWPVLEEILSRDTHSRQSSSSSP